MEIEAIALLSMICGVIGGVFVYFSHYSQKYISKSDDPVYQLLSVSEQVIFDYVTYLIVLIYLLGAISFLIYISVGMISSPIAMMLNHSKSLSQEVYITSEPVVQYVVVSPMFLFYSRMRRRS